MTPRAAAAALLSGPKTRVFLLNPTLIDITDKYGKTVFQAVFVFTLW
jgi:hypothetical protein